MYSGIGAALTGGVLIGVAATLLLYCTGRIAGISGIAAGLLPPYSSETGWRIAFLAGLLTGGVLLLLLDPAAIGAPVARSPVALAAAGFLVGIGTCLGNGCTSGHGICGLSRRSSRSLAATVLFMASGMATVYAVGHLLVRQG